MALPVYHEDLCQLFQRADRPFIVSSREKIQKTLDKLQPSMQNLKQSCMAISKIIDAIVYLRMHLIQPCQIRYDYVVKRKDKGWGLKYIICQRSKEYPQSNDDYSPQQFDFHISGESQLVWNIGKIWLRFFTIQNVSPNKNQLFVDGIIEKNVKDEKVNRLIKKLLNVDSRKRIIFQQFINEQLFTQNQAEQSKFNSSVLVHLNSYSTVMASRHKFSKLQINNPYNNQIRYRCFKQYVEVHNFIEGARKDLKQTYYNQNGSDQVKAESEFSLHIIRLQDYLNMKNLYTQKMEMKDRFQQIQDRIYFTNFTTIMIKIKDQIIKKSRNLKKNTYIKQSFKKFLQDPDYIHEEQALKKFKQVVNQYSLIVRQDIKNSNIIDHFLYRLLLKIYILRTIKYIFNDYRTEIFKPILKQNKFSIKLVIQLINQCSEEDALKKLIANISKFYFPK